MKKIFILFVWCLGLSALGQENLIYQQIQNERLNGEKFAPVQGVFKADKLDPILAKEFKSSKEVHFLQFDAKAISHKERSFSLDLPLNNKTITLELVAVDDSFYDYVVTTDKGETFSANREIKHYRGIVKGDKNSLVAISFFEDEVGGIIANDEGNFNLEVFNKQKGIIFYKDTNLVKQTAFECSAEQNTKSVQYNPKALQQKSKLDIVGAGTKCVRVYFETKYDMYQTKGSVLRVEHFVSTVFNQVSLLYKNENINTLLSTIKVWTTEDPFTGGTTSILLDQFRDYSSSYNGDLAQLLTFKSVGGGIAYYNGLCGTPNWSTSVSGLYTTEVINQNYSWNVMVITHELGHSLSANHTHDCVWNGNNTAIDGCGPTAGYPTDCDVAPLPVQGTIMSYCHAVSSVGINLNLGFGIQPGNAMRDYVANATCLTECGVLCYTNMTLNGIVPNAVYDSRQVSNKITAKNTIQSGGKALYLGKSIVLANGFKASEGAVFLGKVLPCSASNSALSTAINPIEVESTNQETQSIIQVYPNPTSDNITITSDKEIVYWELFNEVGYLSASSKVAHQKEFQVDLTHLKKGLYLIRFTKADGTTKAQKIIKK
ncbi:zinc-dependent metalloprotease [Myroides odoratus]|uniref:zinc-dependent metalloprotease n=1 Tax=Myroides odoratus TaxID=256 RepID=UPI0039B08CE3